MFIAVDGIDGAGKTTLVQDLAAVLVSLGPIVTKEPTKNSKWGELLRAAAVEGRLSLEKELEYFRSDRKHHIETLIYPNLNAGKVVITDRYVDSTLAFQSQTPEEADELYEKLVGEIIVPDITFILHCPVSIGMDRITKRDSGKLSLYENTEVLQRAGQIYESRRDPNYVHLNGDRTPRETLKQALCEMLKRCGHIPEILKLVRSGLSKINAECSNGLIRQTGT